MSCKSCLWPLPCRLPLPFPEPFPEPLTDPFSEPCSEPFSVNFPLPLFLPGMEWRAIGRLTFTFTLVCENPTTRHYKYLHKVQSAVLASASNKNPKNKRNLDKRISDSFHTTTRKVHAGKVNLVTCCCYFGSSALLVS